MSCCWLIWARLPTGWNVCLFGRFSRPLKMGGGGSCVCTTTTTTDVYVRAEKTNLYVAHSSSSFDFVLVSGRAWWPTHFAVHTGNTHFPRSTNYWFSGALNDRHATETPQRQSCPAGRSHGRFPRECVCPDRSVNTVSGFVALFLSLTVVDGQKKTDHYTTH
jgi:hypothetical protein